MTCQAPGCTEAAETNCRYCRGHEGGFDGDYVGRTEREAGRATCTLCDRMGDLVAGRCRDCDRAFNAGRDSFRDAALLMARACDNLAMATPDRVLRKVTQDAAKAFREKALVKP